MQASSGDRRQRAALALAFGLLAAVLAGFLQHEILRYGILLTPDGWGYWQGSVSLLEGRGYRYFFGPTITYWPPLYPLYLAAWQSPLGVSGRTLVLANLALGCAAALSWTLLFALPAFQSPALDNRTLVGALLASLLVAVFVACTVAVHFTYVLAQNLVYALLPLFFLATYLITGERRPAALFLVLAGVNGLLATLLLLTHNSGVAFLPAPAALVLVRGGQTRLLRTVAAVGMFALPLAVWLLVRWHLGQLGSHALSPGAAESRFTDYVWQLAYGVADLLGPLDLGAGWLFLVTLGAALGLGLVRARKDDDPLCVSGSRYLALAGGGALCLLAIFNLTWVHDPLSADRFILFLPLTLFPCAASWHWHAGARQQEATPTGRARFSIPAQATVTVILVCIVGIALYRSLYWISLTEGFREGPRLSRLSRLAEADHTFFAYNELTIDPGFLNRPPMKRGNAVVVSPPLYPWIEMRIRDPNAPEGSWRGDWETPP